MIPKKLGCRVKYTLKQNAMINKSFSTYIQLETVQRKNI